MFSEIGQTQKYKYCRFPLTWVTQYRQIQRRIVVTGGQEGKKKKNGVLLFKAYRFQFGEFFFKFWV
jgi:hypothetical protein